MTVREQATDMTEFQMHNRRQPGDKWTTMDHGSTTNHNCRL